MFLCYCFMLFRVCFVCFCYIVGYYFSVLGLLLFCVDFGLIVGL